MFIFSSGTDPLMILMGFADGSVRVTRFNDDNPSDLSDYIEYQVHDNKTGRINALCLSGDNRTLFTCGDDGNIFSFSFQCGNDSVAKTHPNRTCKLPQWPKLLASLYRTPVTTRDYKYFNAMY